MISSARLVAVALLVPTLAFAAPEVKEGQWEYDVSMDIPGMQVKMTPMKHMQCVTKKDLVPTPPQGRAQCKNVSQKVSGNTATWTMQCKEGDTKMEGHGTATYTADSMQATITNTMTAPGQPAPFKSITKVNGRYVGPCKAGK